jgi:hypothetical protein
MRLPIHLNQLGGADMRISGGGADFLVAQEHLDFPNACASLE